MQNKLTQNEYEVLKLVAKGYSNKEIAQNLYYSINFVKAHVINILRKLNAYNRTHAVYIAFKQGIIS